MTKWNFKLKLYVITLADLRGYTVTSNYNGYLCPAKLNLNKTPFLLEQEKNRSSEGLEPMTISWVSWISEPRSQSHEHGHNFITRNTSSTKMLLAELAESLWAFAIHESMQDINHACPALKSVFESQEHCLQAFASSSQSLHIHEVSPTLSTFAEPLSPLTSYWETPDFYISKLVPFVALFLQQKARLDMFSFSEVPTMLAKWVLVRRHFGCAKLYHQSWTIREPRA